MSDEAFQTSSRQAAKIQLRCHGSELTIFTLQQPLLTLGATPVIPSAAVPACAYTTYVPSYVVASAA